MQSEAICAALERRGIFTFNSIVHVTLEVRKKVFLFLMHKMPPRPQNIFATCKFEGFVIYQQFEQNRNHIYCNLNTYCSI